MKAVKYSTNLWALQNTLTGEYAMQYDPFTGRDEIAVFARRSDARFWAASNSIPVVW